MTSQEQEKWTDPGGMKPVWGGATESSPDLAEPPRAADVDYNNGLWRFQLTWPQPFGVWSVLTLLSGPCHKGREPKTLDKNSSTANVEPYHCQLNVSITESLMSNVQYAAQVILISIVNHKMCPLRTCWLYLQIGEISMKSVEPFCSELFGQIRLF